MPQQRAPYPCTPAQHSTANIQGDDEEERGEKNQNGDRSGCPEESWKEVVMIKTQCIYT